MMAMKQAPTMRRIVPMMDDGRTPQLWEGETIDFTLDRVELSLDAQAPSLGLGQLFVTSKRVIWIGHNAAQCDVDVPYITLHAVSRDLQTYPKHCVYCQLDSDEEDDDGAVGLNEMFLAPEEEIDIMKIFEALSHAALVNPDPPEDGEEEGDDDLIFNEEEVRLGAEQARILNHLDSVFVEPAEYQASDGAQQDPSDDGDAMDA